MSTSTSYASLTDPIHTIRTQSEKRMERTFYSKHIQMFLSLDAYTNSLFLIPIIYDFD